MKISVVIVNWNTRNLLQKSIASIYNTVRNHSVEIFVVDNGSTDGSQQMVRTTFPQVRLIVNTSNLGFAKANNQAMRLCSGEFLLLLNSDATLTEGAVDRLLQAAETNLHGGVFGPQLHYPDGSLQRSCHPLPTLHSELTSLLGLDKRLWAIRAGAPRASDLSVLATGYVDGACQLLRKAMLDQIGLFDERFFFFSEEIDLCRRAHEAGWQVLHIPQAIVIHVGGGSTVSNAARTMQLYRAKLLYFEKHYGQRKRKLLWAAMRATSWVKARYYALVTLASHGRVAKDHIWQIVSEGLRKE